MKGQSEELDLYIYDNSPLEQEIGTYDGLNISYVHDSSNAGLSKAYNEGVRYAAEQKKKWILLLDQDTTLPEDILHKYSLALEHNKDIKLLAPVLLLDDGKILSPCRYKFKRGYHVKEIEEGIYPLRKFSPVNSGIMVHVDSFLAAGGYNEDVKLDFSDFQFIERFRKFFPFFYVINARCIQEFSDNDTFSDQAIRFKFFCEGARAIEKNSVWDRFQYAVLVFARALRLGIRHRSWAFMNTAFGTFLGPKRN